MLMRTDPFRELDRLAEHVLGTSARPAVMPMDAYRDGEAFVVELDLPGVSVDAISLDVERNVLTVRAERPGPQQGREMVAAERPAGVFSRQLFLGDTLDTEQAGGHLRRRRADPAHPGVRQGEAAQDQHRLRRQRRQADPGLTRDAATTLAREPCSGHFRSGPVPHKGHRA